MAEHRDTDALAHLFRLMAAFALAPVVPPALIALETLWDGLPNGGYFKTVLFLYLYGGAFLGLFLGMIAYSMIKRFGNATAANLALAGGSIAALPLLIITLADSSTYTGNGSAFTTLRDNGRDLIVDHEYTCYWYADTVETLIGVFNLGLIGGFVFWLIAEWRRPDPGLPEPSAH